MDANWQGLFLTRKWTGNNFYGQFRRLISDIFGLLNTSRYKYQLVSAQG